MTAEPAGLTGLSAGADPPAPGLVPNTGTHGECRCSDRRNAGPHGWAGRHISISSSSRASSRTSPYP